MSTLNNICPICKGAKHIRTTKGYARCSCVQRDVTQYYISRKIKENDQEIPSAYIQARSWPRIDIVYNGDYSAFRYHCWSSLLQFEKQDVTYQYLDAYRLVEIYLDQDTEFKRVRDLEDYDLVILVLGRAEPPNKMLPALVCQVIQQRQMMGRPTWIYLERKDDSRYTKELMDTLRSIQGIIVQQPTNESIDHRSV